MNTNAETGGMRPQAKGCLEPHKMKEARKCLLLEPLEGAQPCWNLDLGLLASRAMRINYSCFKLPDLWLFIATSVGNSSTREWI